MSGKLAVKDCRDAREKGTPTTLYDGGGLELRVTGIGAASWIFRYQINGRRRPKGIGSYPEITLGDARRERERLRKLVEAGLDPLEEEKAARSKAAAEDGKPKTWRELFEVWLDLKSKKWRLRTVRQVKLRVEKYIMPVLQDVLIPDINNNLVHKVLDKIWLEKPRQGKEVYMHLSSMCRHAAFKGLLAARPIRCRT